MAHSVWDRAPDLLDARDSARHARARDRAVAGRKAAVLAELLAAGFSIPDGFVVPAGTDISGMLADLPSGGSGLERFAVRSSAAAEDGADASFAGQYDTMLNVAPADLAAAIRRVAASGRGDRILAYAGRGALLRGAPASPGLATGAVRVVRDLADAGRLQPGEILVAPLTTPAWTPSFRRAAAVVTDVGNAMSHASIVAREFGIPVVVGCGDATARLTDGERVTVDGAAGTVTREG